MNETVQGYVIRTTPYQENSVIVTLLTKDGQVSFKARGAMKTPSKFASLVQPYTFGNYQLSFKTEIANKTLEAGEIITILPTLFTDLQTSVLLTFITESIIRNPDLPQAYEIFDIIFNHLKTKNNFATIIAIVLKYHLFYCGCYLTADECVACGKTKGIVTVAYDEGGFLCEDCNRHLHLPYKDPLYLKSFRYVMKADIININDFSIDKSIEKELISDLLEHLEKNSGLNFKCKNLILKCLS